jgi:hypothetical protein
MAGVVLIGAFVFFRAIQAANRKAQEVLAKQSGKTPTAVAAGD